MKTYTRQQLHDLVWSGPMREVSKTLGLSDNGLRKYCVKAFVPLPPQGHWNKVHAGQKVKTSPLPPRPPGVSDIIQIGQWDYRQYQKELEQTEPVAPVFDEAIESLRERVSRNIGVVLASKNLSPPHAAFRRQVEDDARKALQSSWHTPIFNTPLEKRRLRILQGLFYGLSRLDCSVTVQGRETRTIYVNVGHQTVSIGLEHVANRRQALDEKISERLKFSIFKGHDKTTERASWSDSDEQLLESQLTSIAVEVIVAGELQYREHQVWVHEERLRTRERNRQEAIKKKLEQEKAERERLLKLEADRLKRLTDSAENYELAQSIRRFVSSVVDMPAGDVDPVRIADWREWALQQADKLDPIATGSIWNDVNDSS